jgi:hypothetical protein
MSDLFGGEDCVGGGEEIEHAELIGGTPETPGITVRAIGVERERREGWACWRHERKLMLYLVSDLRGFESCLCARVTCVG